ncbi:MAG: PIN domain-containing protein [Candidatus Pacearchaeota archaeon]
MEVVLDSNVLFRNLISGGNILDLVFDNRLRIYAPLKLNDEIKNNKSEILSKSKLSKQEFDDLFSLVFEKINWVSKENYVNHLDKSEEILAEHKKDKDFIALCMSKQVKLWTYENRLIDTGHGITTKEISEFLS